MHPARETTRFNICLAAVNPGAAAFDRVASQLQGALSDLGYSCEINVNRCIDGAVNILLGQTMQAWPFRGHVMPTLLERQFVFYQLIQLDGHYPILEQFPEYPEVLAHAAAIWEFAPGNMAHLANSPWTAKLRHLPPYFHPALESFRPAAEQTTDVLIFGAQRARRDAIIARLVARGVKAVFVGGAYGEALNREIANARIVLNVGGFEREILNTRMLAHALANGCFAISETADHNPFGDGVVYAPYEALVDACLAYLGPRAGERAAVAAAGFAAVRACNMTDNLRPLLAALPVDALVAVP